MSTGSTNPLWHKDGRGQIRFKSERMLADGLILECTAVLAVEADAIQISWTVEAMFDPDEIAVRVGRGEPKPDVQLTDVQLDAPNQHHVVIARISSIETCLSLPEAKQAFETKSSAAANIVLHRVRAALIYD